MFFLKFDYLWQMSSHLKINPTVLQPSSAFTQSVVWELFMASSQKQGFLTCWKGNTIKENSNCAIILLESYPVPCGAELRFASGIIHPVIFCFFPIFHLSLINVTKAAMDLRGTYGRKYCTHEFVPMIAALLLNCTSVWLLKKQKNKAVI